MAFTVSNLPAATTAVPGHGVESTIAPKSFDPAATIGRPAPKSKESSSPEATKAEPEAKTGSPTISEETSKSEAAPNAQGISPQLAALARREAKLRQEATALENERVEIAELKALKEKLAKKDYSELKKFVDYDEYTNYLIEQSSKEDPNQQAIVALKSEVESLRESQKQDIDKRYEAIVGERRRLVKDLVETNPEFSTIKELKHEETVVQHILDTYEDEGVELSPEEAAKEVEQALLEEAKTWTSLSKLKSAEPEKKDEPKADPKVKTLTNTMQATGEIKRNSKPLHLIQSDVERWREARLRAQDKAQGK
jgi:hypothetical protein